MAHLKTLIYSNDSYSHGNIFIDDKVNLTVLISTNFLSTPVCV